jgi:hypothetical protein
MLKRWLPLMGLALTVTACSSASRTSVDRVTGGFPPFDQLQKVKLGMQARDLVRARPQAQPEGYVGYRETVDGYLVDYLVPGSYSEEREVPAGARVTGVTATRRFLTRSAASEAWRRAVTTVRPDLGGTRPQCFGIAGGSAPGKVAVWKGGRTELVISTYAPHTQRHAGGSTSEPASLIAELRREGLATYVLNRMRDDGRQAGPRRVPEPCPGPRETTH